MPITTDPSIHPSIIPLSPLLPVSSLSWFASVSLLDGWGYGFSFFFLVSIYDCNGCIFTVAWIEAAHATSHPQLSYCPWLCKTVMYFVKKRENIVQPPSAGSRGWISNFLFDFLSLSSGHMSVCVVLSHDVECFHLKPGSWLSDLMMLWAVCSVIR